MNKMKNWFREGAGTVISLYDCFLAYFKKEELVERDNLYDCDNCGMKSQATAFSLLKKLPNILIIQIKRFRYSHWGSKVSSHIQLPINLCLS